MTKEIFQIMAEQQAARKPFAVATVVETRGSVSAKTGAKAVIDADGTMIAGWVGGGCAESSTREAAIKCIETGRTTVLDIDLDDEMLGAGMPCGGSMRVYIEPVLPKPTLWIMGHGRIAECVCLLGDLLGFNVVVNDPAAAREQYPAAARLITDDLHYDQLTPQASDFVVIATQHKGDHESMRRTLASQAQYVALIASRKRSKLVMEYLREEGFPQTELERVRAPAGLDLGAKTPEEIALCVMSEMVLIRRHGSGLPMREKPQAGGKQVKSQAAG
jgi:xanthine dehydrogenase accessory factor